MSGPSGSDAWRRGISDAHHKSCHPHAACCVPHEADMQSVQDVSAKRHRQLSEPAVMHEDAAAANAQPSTEAANKEAGAAAGLPVEIMMISGGLPVSTVLEGPLKS